MFGVPFAARYREEVTPVHVNCPGQALDRIDHRMDDVMSQRYRVPFAERFCAGGLNATIGHSRWPAPENVVFAASVNADDGPHPVVVWQLTHPRSPDEVEDRHLG